MPKRTDIETIMVIGSGPIVIGQAVEFDYSGTQACKALRELGYRIVLVNSNPATIMTDPEFADATYVEPLTVEICEKIIEKEKPDVLLPTVGGQTALNLALDLKKAGVLERHNVGLIGATLESIEVAEDREMFKEVMEEIGLKSPKSRVVGSVQEALEYAEEIGYPVLVRPSYTLGGSGGGVAYTPEQLKKVAANGIHQSPVGEVLVDQSLLGWKEYELELMRDGKGNFVVVCSIENLDPMGVHTGDSITVAPAQTLTDKELQRLRNCSRAIFDRIGITTGGANVQFAISPETGEVFVIEMNPRVSRSSALASKATGFPIAKLAALVAVGLTLDEVPNDITKETPASFEPSLDYVVVKIPRWDFRKFEGVDPTLGPQMKAVGEVMAIGRTFPEALQKAIRSLDIGIEGLASNPEHITSPDVLSTPTAQRLYQVATAIREGLTIDEVIEQTGFDRWYVQQMHDTIHIHDTILKRDLKLTNLNYDDFMKLKRYGFGDQYIAQLVGEDMMTVRHYRKELGVIANFYRVDTCAAEFEAQTPYLYSTYEEDSEAF
ncbi:MAG: carbamoyl-phosphate synthase large subunit, partial [Chloroflexota bacterium]